MRLIPCAVIALAACQFDEGGGVGEPDARPGPPDASAIVDAAAGMPDGAPMPDAPPPVDAVPVPDVLVPDAAGPIGLVTTGPSSTVGNLGGTGGVPFTEDCPDGRVVTGFAASDNSFGITRVSATCCRLVIDAGGSVSTVDPIPTPEHGTETSIITIDPIDCPVDEVVVGFSGTYSSSDLVHSIRIRCAPLTWDGVDYAVGSAAEVPEDLGSPDGFGTDFAECGADEVAGGFAGRAGTILDSFRLRCFALAPVFPP